VESLEKPVGDRLLQAMAQAYPDVVDLGLLSMVMGCDPAALQAAARALVDAGQARARVLHDGSGERLDAPCITDRGMLVADGVATDAEQAVSLLERVEAAALRKLLQTRIGASRLPTQQADELRGSLDAVSDSALVDAAKVWANQTVGDWRGLIRAMGGTATVAG
jgi:ribosomal protein S12 methylthiotransferase accessory factor YcaO